jgi:hypothetical protein
MKNMNYITPIFFGALLVLSAFFSFTPEQAFAYDVVCDRLTCPEIYGGGEGGIDTGNSCGDTWTYTYWFEPGVGLVRSVSYISVGDSPEELCLPTLEVSEVSVALTATPSTITRGSSSILSWTSQNATSCTGVGFSTGGATSGSVTVTPTENANYTIICYSGGVTSGTWALSEVDIIDFVCAGNEVPVSGGGVELEQWTNIYNENECPSNTAPSGACTTSQWCAVNTWNPVRCWQESAVFTCNIRQAGDQASASATVTVLQPQPDLTAVTESVTVNPGSGSTVFRGRIRNIGTGSTGASTGDVRYQIDWNADGSLNEGFRQQNIIQQNLVSQASQSVEASWGNPRVGNHRFRICADLPSNTIAESNEGNNCSGWRTFSVSQTIDLTATITNASVNQTSVAVNGYISNIGSRRTSSEANYRWQVDRGANGSVDENFDEINGIEEEFPAGGQESVSRTFTIPAGTHNIRLCADQPGNNVSESNEGNNCSGWYGVTTTAPPPPPLPPPPPPPVQPDPEPEPVPDATLSLTAEPTLVRLNDTVVLTWSVSNASGCSLVGTNGNVWSSLGSSGSRTSSGITSETTFTLSCTDLNDEAVSRSVTVKLVPSFQEVMRTLPQLFAGLRY